MLQTHYPNFVVKSHINGFLFALHLGRGGGGGEVFSLLLQETPSAKYVPTALEGRGRGLSTTPNNETALVQHSEYANNKML